MGLFPDYGLAASWTGARRPEDFAAAMECPTGPPPATAGTGIGMLAPGRAADLTLPDDTGEYVLFCMLPDVAGDGAPHIGHGMLSEASVT